MKRDSDEVVARVIENKEIIALETKVFKFLYFLVILNKIWYKFYDVNEPKLFHLVKCFEHFKL